MVMMGVLTQMLPVLAGVTIPKVLWVSRIVHLLMGIGAFLFPLGMVMMNHTLIQVGALSVWFSLLIFYSITLISLQKGIQSFTITSFKLSSLSAFMTLVLAGRLAWGWADFGEFSLYRSPMIELHIAWAFFGMVFTLLMGVSYKVVPMFYVTADHPKWLTHHGSKIIFSLLLLWTLIFQTYIFEKMTWLQNLIPFIKGAISIVVIAFSFETIKRLNNRKRPITDTSIIYWKLSMVLFFLGAILYNISQLYLFATVSFGLAILSLISGMLYKIIPFLIWFHLSAKGLKSVPTMRELLPDRLTRKQLYLHFCTMGSLILIIFFPKAKILFSFFLSLSSVTTFLLLLRPVKIYRKISAPV